MKVHVIGGGPAGLYFAILMKKAWPRRRHHRLRAQPPGRHVRLRRRVLRPDARPPSRPTTARATARSSAISPTGTTSRSTSRARRTASAATASAAARASTLLQISAAERARALGVAAQVRDRSSTRASRRIRGRRPGGRRRRHQLAHPRGVRRDHFAPSIDLRPNKFAWMGSTRPFDAFTFFFRETEHGIFIAHCYQYEPGRSTWVIETRPRDLRARRPRQARRGGIGALSSKTCSPTSCSGHRLHHQPLDLAQFPDHPLRALGHGQHRADRRRQGDRAFLDRLRHQARDGGRDRALRGVPRNRRARRQRGARAFRDGSGATRSRRPSTRPTCRSSGSSTSTASGTWTRRASPSA